jgi:hypothetical protein
MGSARGSRRKRRSDVSARVSHRTRAPAGPVRISRNPEGQRLRHRRNTGMIGLHEQRLIDRRSPISRCRPHGPRNTPDDCDAANVVPSPVVLVRSDRERVYPHDQRGAFRRQATGQRLSQLARQVLFHPGRRRVAGGSAQGRNVDPDSADRDGRLRQRSPARHRHDKHKRPPGRNRGATGPCLARHDPISNHGPPEAHDRCSWP